jgi:hypothetical protein
VLTTQWEEWACLFAASSLMLGWKPSAQQPVCHSQGEDSYGVSIWLLPSLEMLCSHRPIVPEVVTPQWLVARIPSVIYPSWIKERQDLKFDFARCKIKLPCNRPWKPIGLWDVEAPTFSLDNRLTDGGKCVSLKRRPPAKCTTGKFHQRFRLIYKPWIRFQKTLQSTFYCAGLLLR